jgi:hypothetical protein
MRLLTVLGKKYCPLFMGSGVLHDLFHTNSSLQLVTYWITMVMTEISSIFLSRCLLVYILALYFYLSVKQSWQFLPVTINMYVLSTWLLFPIINALVTVQIHRNSLYHPRDSCAFIRNASWSTDASIQSCIWECVNEYNCQTAVYFKDINNCSMFAEFWETGSIEPSRSVSASVICYRKSHGNFILCCEIEYLFFPEPIIACPSTVTSTPEQSKCIIHFHSC